MIILSTVWILDQIIFFHLKINLEFYANCFFLYPLSLQVFFSYPKQLHHLRIVLCNELTQGRTWIYKNYEIFSGKVCQYLESKYVDPVRAGKTKTTLHFSNACILQFVRSTFFKKIESQFIVINYNLWALGNKK